MDNKLNKDYLIANGVDVNHGLEMLGDMDTYNDIMDSYADETVGVLENIRNAKASNDMLNYSINVHTLKSSSRYVGFMTLGNLAEEQEMASKANNMEVVNSKYDLLMSEANKALNIAKTYLGKNIENNNQVENQNVVEENHELNNMVANNDSRKTVLVAEDSPVVREFVKEALSDEYNVVGASDGKEAAEVIAKDPTKVDTLLLDLRMAGVDGFTVLNWFKQNNLFNTIPVAVMTGADDKESILKVNEYPVVDMIIKPCDKGTIKAVVEKATEKKEMMQIR